tara:strand:- start:2349 stop:2801 length:453 start_codon:yes stop_codon:yes gene_type:complete
MSADTNKVVVAFTKTNQKGFWKWVIGKHVNFSHCWVVFYQHDTDTWNWLEYNNTGFKFVSKRGDEATEMLATLVGRCTCIEITPKHRYSKVPQYLWPWLYCVSFCKHVIGVAKWSAITPYQLYCELLKRGGKEIFTEYKENCDGKHIQNT